MTNNGGTCQAGATTPPEKYQADGTIQVQVPFGADKLVTFIPDRYVEQNDSKFVVFLPQCQAASTAHVVNGKEVPLRLDEGLADEEALLLQVAAMQVAVNRIKVTVVVSPSANGGLDLKEVVIPAVPTSPTTR